MSTKNDGGPAFPSEPAWNPNGDMVESGFRGMSLRDWFAGQALNGLLSQSPTPFWSAIKSYFHVRISVEEKRKNPSMQNVFLQAATDAYRIADAMLKAREQ